MKAVLQSKVGRVIRRMSMSSGSGECKEPASPFVPNQRRIQHIEFMMTTKPCRVSDYCASSGRTMNEDQPTRGDV